jgi:hypothetical protein
MIGRIVTFALVAALATLGLTGGATATESSRDDVILARDEDAPDALIAQGDDGDDSDDDDSDSATSGVDSNDRTNSRHSAVSRGDDRSRGDLTRDRTKDGPGAATRDRTAGSTNDRSRNDTR